MRTSEAAAALARRRWAQATAEERAAFGAAGGRGGRAAWAGLSAEERSEIMRARAAKRRPRKSRLAP